jgi:hypothetical protein
MDEIMRRTTLALWNDPREEEVDAIHASTGIYTSLPEIESLLDRMDWPATGDRLLDPGAGNGGFLVAALGRIPLDKDDQREANRRVHGYEFHPSAAASARNAVTEHLIGRGWTDDVAERTGRLMVETADFLLDAIPKGVWDRIAANPPYLRYANLPLGYRESYDGIVEPHARPDMLYAYLARASEVIARDGVVGMITADRWLLNSGCAELRERLGRTWSIRSIDRLDSASAFYRPKSRGRGTPARVHPVALVMTTGEGRSLARGPFAIDEDRVFEGVPLSDHASIRLAPWLGPEGVFLLADRSGFQDDEIVPCYEPQDLTGRTAGAPRMWAIATDTTRPSETVVRHLEENMHRMPARGRRKCPWLPPESFHGRLPLTRDAVVVPRISQTLRGVVLPAGTMPVNHNLVIVSGLSTERMMAVLEDPRVRAQADSLALRLESGYRSYTATLLRSLRIPEDLLP